MHTLKTEYLQLNTEGVLDEPAARRAIALDQGDIFSLHSELRFALYAAVAAVVTGIGILLKNNLDRIGPVTLIIALACIALLCYASAERARRRGAARSLGGDYVLLLGALILSADLGYAEARFRWLDASWSWHLLLLAALHAITAYYFSSRLVLSVSLTSLAGWFGVQAHIGDLFGFGSELRQAGIQALLCAGVIMAWREAHLRTGKEPPFVEVLEHFAANLAFWGALALSFDDATRWPGMLLVLGLAAIGIRTGLRDGQEAFIVYGVGYAALGLCVFEANLIAADMLAVLLALITIVVAANLLWRFHSQLKAADK